MDELTEKLAALRILKGVEKESRMNPEKIAKMESLHDFIRYLLASIIQIKMMFEEDPDVARRIFGKLWTKIGMKLYDLRVEKQKQIIKDEAERCKKIADRSNSTE